jgi:hypothetical protein
MSMISPQDFYRQNHSGSSGNYTQLHNTGDAAILRDRRHGGLIFIYRHACGLRSDQGTRKLFEAAMRKLYEEKA